MIHKALLRGIRLAPHALAPARLAQEAQPPALTPAQPIRRGGGRALVDPHALPLPARGRVVGGVERRVGRGELCAVGSVLASCVMLNGGSGCI